MKWKLMQAVMVAGVALFARAAERRFSYPMPTRTDAKTAVAAEDGIVRYESGIAADSVGFVPETGDVLTVEVFNGKSFGIEVGKCTVGIMKAFLGKIGGVACASIVCTDDGLLFDIQDLETGETYKVLPKQAAVSVLRFAPARDGKKKCGVCEHRDALQVPLSKCRKVEDACVTAAAAVSGAVNIDVLIVYDQRARSWATSNGGGMAAFAASAVQRMNTGIANTGLDSYYQFRLVGVKDIPVNTSNASVGLDGISPYTGTYGTSIVTEVANLKKSLGADVVVHLIDTGDLYGVVGIAWSRPSLTYALGSSFQYACCNVRNVAQDHTMTHEVGHNMGAGHSNTQEAGNRGPQLSDAPYSCGYVFKAGGTTYHTIMAYNADDNGSGYTECPYYSSPSHYFKGVAVGTASVNDNTRVLRQTYLSYSQNESEPLTVISLNEAADNTLLTFTTGGNANWFGQTQDSHDGTDAVRSGAIGDSQSTWLQTTVTGPGSVAFWWKTSSESGYDKLTFSIDGTSKEDVSGSGSWTQKTYSLGSGTHTLKWTYAKDSSVSNGEDCGWVDQIVWTPTTPSYTVTFSLGTHGTRSGGGALTQTVVQGGAATAPTVTANAGYTFTGWDRSFSSVTGNLTVTAQYSLVNYAITYSNTKGAANAANPATYTIESGTITFQPLPDVTGWRFTGWSPSSIASGSTGAKTVTAQWEEVTTVVALNEAVDNDDLFFTTGGDANWFKQTNVSYVGGDAAQSGSITKNQSTWLQTTVTGPGTLIFWWKVSSEGGNFDYVFCEIDGGKKDQIGGINSDWAVKTYALSYGTHTIRWIYRKDGSVDNGSDCAWVDGIVWVPSADVTDATTPDRARGIPAVPYTWLDSFSGLVSGGNYEAAIHKTGVNGIPVWQSYVAGLNPTLAGSKFRVYIEPVDDGTMAVKFDPVLSGRRYTILGRRDLSRGFWGEADMNDKLFLRTNRFFKVKVEMAY